MNLNRALQILAKFFAVNPDIFKPVHKDELIAWGEQVKTGGPLYKLTRNRHAFLAGEIQSF